MIAIAKLSPSRRETPRVAEIAGDDKTTQLWLDSFLRVEAFINGLELVIEIIE